MFGLPEALISFIRRQVGLRTDAANSAGSLHAKAGDIRNKLGLLLDVDNIQYAARMDILGFSQVAETDVTGAKGIVAWGDYIYFGGSSTAYKVYKYRKSDLTKVAESASSGSIIYALAISPDGEYVYAGAGSTVRKYKTSDMSQVGTVSYGGQINVVTAVGDYVYVGGYSTNKVYKYRKSDLTKVAESVSYGADIRGIGVSGDYVYACGQTTKTVCKYNISDLSKVSESEALGDHLLNLIIIGDNIYVVTGSTVQKILRLKSDLTKTGESAALGDFSGAIDTDGDYIFVAEGTNKKIHVLNAYSLEKTVDYLTETSIDAVKLSDGYLYWGNMNASVFKLEILFKISGYRRV